jgi:hypothetical protein
MLAHARGGVDAEAPIEAVAPNGFCPQPLGSIVRVGAAAG